jgi:hypothetical protein
MDFSRNAIIYSDVFSDKIRQIGMKNINLLKWSSVSPLFISGDYGVFRCHEISGEYYSADPFRNVGTKSLKNGGDVRVNIDSLLPNGVEKGVLHHEPKTYVPDVNTIQILDPYFKALEFEREKVRDEVEAYINFAWYLHDEGYNPFPIESENYWIGFKLEDIRVYGKGYNHAGFSFTNSYFVKLRYDLHLMPEIVNSTGYYNNRPHKMFIHPHVSTKDGLCMGNARGRFERAIRKGNKESYAEAILIIKEVLSNYRVSTSYRPIESCITEVAK